MLWLLLWDRFRSGIVCVKTGVVAVVGTLAVAGESAVAWHLKDATNPYLANGIMLVGGLDVCLPLFLVVSRGSL